jgi:hypothetical protein
MKPLPVLLLSLAIACGQSGDLAKSPAAAVAASTSASNAPPDVPLFDEAGRADTVAARLAQTPLTVLLVFTAECPVQKAHDGRVREIVGGYGARGVSFFAIASEVGADLPAEREEARRRALGLPVLEDRGAALANALGVEYSTHAVLLDRERRVLYTGAIDGDRSHLTDHAEPYLKNALEAALAGKAVAKSRTEALGCPLRKR